MIDDIKKDAQTRMQKSVEALRHDLTKVRTGRASTALVDHLKVNYYGSDMPLTQVASVTVADARSLVITPWEKPMVQAVEKAILASDLGLNPTTAGTVIRINLPALPARQFMGRRDLLDHRHQSIGGRSDHALAGRRRPDRIAEKRGHPQGDAGHWPGERLPSEKGEGGADDRSEEHTSELQSLMRISYAVFCLKKKKKHKQKKAQQMKNINKANTNHTIETLKNKSITV